VQVKQQKTVKFISLYFLTSYFKPHLLCCFWLPLCCSFHYFLTSYSWTTIIPNFPIYSLIMSIHVRNTSTIVIKNLGLWIMALCSLVGGCPHAASVLHSEEGSHMFFYSCATHIINFYQHENLMWKVYWKDFFWQIIVCHHHHHYHQQWRLLHSGLWRVRRAYSLTIKLVLLAVPAASYVSPSSRFVLQCLLEYPFTVHSL